MFVVKTPMGYVNKFDGFDREPLVGNTRFYKTSGAAQGKCATYYDVAEIKKVKITIEVV